jgi:15-cis-phytoene synthase
VAEAPAPADPERALALAYAPGEARPALSALWRLDEQLGSIVARTETPAVGQMRLTWWHDALSELRTSRPVDPLLRDLAESRIDATALLPLIDGWETLLDPLPLSAEALERYATARGATLFAAAADLLGTGPAVAVEAGRLWALVDLGFRVSDRPTAVRALDLARDCKAPRYWPRRLRPLGALAVLAKRDARRGLDASRSQGSPARVARMAAHALTGL